MKAQAAVTEMLPAGISRVAVRGFLASMSRSTTRLKPMAEDRAKSMHSTMSTSCTQENPSMRQASTLAARAKGSAKMVWLTLIIRA